MARFSIILRISFFLFLCIGQTDAWSQANIAYIKYLSLNRLKLEHSHYLSDLKTKIPQDSVEYLQLKFDLQYRESQGFQTQRIFNSSLFQNDSNAMILCALWHMEEAFQIDIEGANLMANSPFTSCRMLGHAWHMGLSPLQYDAPLMWPEDLKNAWYNYKKYQKKKPWKAVALSVVVPGFGKVYAQRSRTALINVLGLGAYGWQAWESYRKLGIGHPFTVFNLAVFGVFYSGHIYGSARAVKTRSLELRYKFFKDASLYYRRLYRPVLY